VESAFRPFGPRGRAVRPSPEEKQGKDFISDRGKSRLSLVEGAEKLESPLFPLYRFRVRIFRGFRHQIRCHLAWLGFPLLNDSLYGGALLPGAGEDPPSIGLRAQGLSFPDPAGEGTIVFSLPELNPGDLLA
jgi:23S rRNA pseudouridine1911/1915/1917 synthase